MKINRTDLFKIFLAVCISASLYLAGCADSNPLATDDNTNTGTGTSTNTDTSTSESYTIYGTVTSTTGASITDKNIKVTATNIADTSKTKSCLSEKKSAYSISNITEGFYELKAEVTDNSGSVVYEPSVSYYYIDTSCQKKIDLSMLVIDNGSGAISKLNFYGKVVDMLGNELPFTTIKVSSKNNSEFNYSTTTNISDGGFCILGLASDTYTVTFSKPSFTTVSCDLVINDNTISFAGTLLSEQTSFKDAAGNDYNGYNVSKVTLPIVTAQSGAIAGVLKNAANTEFDLYRREGAENIYAPSKVGRFITNGDCEFIVSGLQKGYYTAVIKDKTFNTVSSSSGDTYIFDKADIYFANMLVSEGATTEVR